MTEVVVFIPVLNRPQRVKPLIESLEASLSSKVTARPVFICSPDDDAEIAAVRAIDLEPLIVEWQPGRGDYAKKMNHAWRHTDEEFVFLGADDLVFHPDWFDAALRVHRDLHPCVIGTNDMGNARVMAGRHSTHTLVHRAYGECGTVDDPTVLLHEGYDHNFVDDEFIQTAMWRETYAFAVDARIEHFHPDWGKGTVDETYEKGKRHFGMDSELFHLRVRLWSNQR